MDNEKLIEFVREYKFLYDLEDKKYSDNKKKDQAWNEIGIKLNSNGKQCKKAWCLLRDAFRRNLKKNKTLKVGMQVHHKKKWKFEDEMMFLLPYMKEKPTLCPIPTTPALSSADDANKESSAAEELAQSSDGQQTVSTLPTLSSLSTFQTKPQPKTIKNRKKSIPERPSTVLMKYLLDCKKNTQPDDIEQFMAGITTTLRSFPARDRAIAKAKIFEVVSRMEIDILSRPSTSNVSMSSSSTSYSENTPSPNTMEDFYENYFSSEEQTQYEESN